MQRIFDDGTLPGLTNARRTAGANRSYSNGAGVPDADFRRYRSSYLSFLDTAGESLDTQRAIEELKFLTNVDAFILMLDPFTLPEAMERLGLPESAPTAASTAFDVLAQVTEALRKPGRGVNRERADHETGGRRVRQDRRISRTSWAWTIRFSAPRQDDPWLTTRPGEPSTTPCANCSANGEHATSTITWRPTTPTTGTSRCPRLAATGLRRARVAAAESSHCGSADPLVWLLSLYKLVPRRRGGG